MQLNHTDARLEAKDLPARPSHLSGSELEAVFGGFAKGMPPGGFGGGFNIPKPGPPMNPPPAPSGGFKPGGKIGGGGFNISLPPAANPSPPSLPPGFKPGGGKFPR